MPAPMTRAASRGSQFVRMWTLLVLLRGTPRTLAWLAAELGTSERTVRRDLAVLEAVGMPIERLGDNEDGTAKARAWCVGEIREWPRGHATPTGSLRAEGFDQAGRGGGLR